jgi:TPP-dependent pyruvate/acetoin dehydrogenase alpha subunit
MELESGQQHATTIPTGTQRFGVAPPDLLALYGRMQLIRLCEERLVKSHQRGLVHGACHTYIGQEAVAAGVCANLRGHGHALAKGLDPRQLLAELYGRQTGCSRGRGGSMHLFAPEIGLLGTSGVVGPCILQAAGAGYSFRLLKTDRVAVTFFGDGAVNNGAFHEGLNLASIWKLPVLFVCENNQYATEIAFADAAGNPSVAARGVAYGLPGVEVDGNDVLAVHEVACDAARRARAGEGPTLIECKTYRTRPHAEGMGDYTYRTREEVDHWKTRCPIARFKRHLLEAKLVDAAELEAVDREIAAQVEDAHRFAEASPWPTVDSATKYVYAGESEIRSQESGSKDGPATRLPPAPCPLPPARELTFMKATLEALTEEMAKNPKIFVLGEGIGPSWISCLRTSSSTVPGKSSTRLPRCST